MPFQFWHRHEALTKNATFVDIDYPQLIEKKRDRILSNSLLRETLFKTHVRHSRPPVYLRSERYLAIGCDLRDLVTLESQLRAELDMNSCSVLFLSEVALTYMPVTDSDALIRLASTFEDGKLLQQWCMGTHSHRAARFCMLEQYLPQGPDHPFAHTMLAHFKKLQASIYAIEQYLTLEQQYLRFLNSGWTTLHICRNLWDLYSDDTFTPPSLRRKLDSIEPFDEWEEFALYGGHYFLLEASNAKLKSSTEISGLNRSTGTDSPTIDTSESKTFELCHQTDGMSTITPRRYAATFKPDEDSVTVHGGQGHQGRLSSMDVLRRDSGSQGTSTSLAQDPHARMCHTITSLGLNTALLVGGRASPSEAFKDCWLVKDGAWTQVHDLETGRYRHCAAAVALNGDTSHLHGVLAYGGKASDGTVLSDWLIWSQHDGWHRIPVDADGPQPVPRFGAAFSAMASGRNTGLLVGGMCQSGTVLEDIWQWTVSTTPTLRIILRDLTNGIRGNLSNAAYGRLGASLVPWGDTTNTLMLIGGVSKAGTHSLSEDFVLLTCNDTEVSIRAPSMQLPSTWPLLVGMGVVSASPNEIVIVGGGAVCFSMGSFWNQGYFTVTKGGAQKMGLWRLAQRQTNGTAEANPVHAPSRRSLPKPKKGLAVQSKTVPHMTLQSAEDFAKVVAASKPVVIQGLDIGPCTDLWTTEYLKEKIGEDRELVVHECSSERMTFKDKNFQYVKRSASAFLDGIAQGSRSYLRAVSSTQPNKLPTKLEEDFPTIAADFRLPAILDVVKSNLHSSPLRISGPVSLWLHYDVLSNILCQIRGTKTLHLYPPSDVKYLDYPPGGSSSNTDILASKNPRLHPHIATLKHGEILFIPPMWSHTATPNDGVSVAVNVFWKDLEKGYAAGRDVYGNRDLQAYENGRRDVEKIVRAFRDVPVDMAKFYMERLAGEILDGAEKIGRKGKVQEGREEGDGGV